METSIEQQLVETVRILPEEKQKDVLAYAKKISENESEPRDEQTERPPTTRKLFQMLEQMRAELPKDVWENYPTDGSLNHDHYLYGAPKRKQ